MLVTPLRNQKWTQSFRSNTHTDWYGDVRLQKTTTDWANCRTDWVTRQTWRLSWQSNSMRLNSIFNFPVPPLSPSHFNQHQHQCHQNSFSHRREVNINWWWLKNNARLNVYLNCAHMIIVIIIVCLSLCFGALTWNISHQQPQPTATPPPRLTKGPLARQ